MVVETSNCGLSLVRWPLGLIARQTKDTSHARIAANRVAEFRTRETTDFFLVLDHLLPEYEKLLARIAETLKAQLMEALTR